MFIERGAVSPALLHLVLFQEAFGFIERADVVKEIFFHYSEFKGDLEALQAGDDVEFTIKDRNVNVKLSDLAVSYISVLFFFFLKLISFTCHIL